MDNVDMCRTSVWQPHNPIFFCSSRYIMDKVNMCRTSVWQPFDPVFFCSSHYIMDKVDMCRTSVAASRPNLFLLFTDKVDMCGTSVWQPHDPVFFCSSHYIMDKVNMCRTSVAASRLNLFLLFTLHHGQGQHVQNKCGSLMTQSFSALHITLSWPIFFLLFIGKDWPNILRPWSSTLKQNKSLHCTSW